MNIDTMQFIDIQMQCANKKVEEISGYFEHPLMPNITRETHVLSGAKVETFIEKPDFVAEQQAKIIQKLETIDAYIKQLQSQCADAPKHGEVQACLQVIKRLISVMEIYCDRYSATQRAVAEAKKFVYDPNRADPERLKMYLDLMRLI